MLLLSRLRANPHITGWALTAVAVAIWLVFALNRPEGHVPLPRAQIAARPIVERHMQAQAGLPLSGAAHDSTIRSWSTTRGARE